MKRRLWLGAVLMMAMIFVAGTALAGQYTSPKDKAKVAAIDKRLVTEKAAIAEKYAKQNRERQAAAKVTVPKPAVSDDVVPAGKGFRRMLTAGVKAFFTSPGALVIGVYEGIKYVSSSKLENPLSRFCRGVNVGFDQAFGNILGSAMEFATPWKTTEYADPSQLNFIAKETITWGPLAQMLRTGASVAPVVCAATNVIGPLAGLTVIETTAVVGGSSVPGGVLVGKAADMAEKKLIK